ncbi:hypothetical protein D3C72_2493250 [compost metagenome]
MISDMLSTMPAVKAGERKAGRGGSVKARADMVGFLASGFGGGVGPVCDANRVCLNGAES